ncbi:MAG: polysaccharide deacetylase, partial [Clostridia bacterium]|nr:polysaccharide deacetylase [Clostridia bacterium]
QLTEVGKENMKHIYHSETKRAFITFDDGPSNITPQILDTLKEEGVKATFFMLGCNVVNFPETTKRVYNEGHYIANHGYTHQYSSIYSSTQAVLDEYNRCNEAVKNALGEPEYNSHLFRFPGGMPGGKYASLKKEARQLLEDNGILSVDWNALTGDAETSHPQADKLMQELQETTEGKNSVVILMHDAQAKKVTADILPQVINYLREQGYELKTFYDIIK